MYVRVKTRTHITHQQDTSACSWLTATLLATACRVQTRKDETWTNIKSTNSPRDDRPVVTNTSWCVTEAPPSSLGLLLRVRKAFRRQGPAESRGNMWRIRPGPRQHVDRSARDSHHGPGCGSLRPQTGPLTSDLPQTPGGSSEQLLVGLLSGAQFKSFSGFFPGP